MSKAEFSFGRSFQDSMLTLMLTDLSFADKAIKYIPEERLFSEGHKFLFKAIKKKFETTGTVPSYLEIEDQLKYVERAKRRMLKAFAMQIFESRVTDVDFLKEKLTEYARKNAFIKIFQDGQILWNSRKHDDAYSQVMQGINDLYGISFHDDVAIGFEDFEDFRQRYIHSNVFHNSKIPTSIEPVDEILNGGLEKGELGILLAEAKKGKSIGLIHMGCAALAVGAGNVAHFVLEGLTEQTIMRYQARLSGIDYNQIAKDEITKEQTDRLEMIGNTYLKNLQLVPMNKHWNYTVLEIEAKIKELTRRGLKPDLVVVDYADLLKSHERHENIRIEQTWVYRYLKQMAMMHNVAIWTACMSGDTKIHTLCGHIAIKDLVGKTNIPVYAYNHEKGCIEIQTIESVFETSRAAEVWEVEFDNGEKVKMTPNHQLLLRNGKYQELRQCKIGDSIMPLYQHVAKYGKDRSERFTVLNTSPRDRKRESRMVGAWLARRNLLSIEHVHHRDEDPLNNHPDNLEIMSNADHKRRHQLASNWMKTLKGKAYWEKNNCQFRDEVKKKTSESMRQIWADRKANGIKINTRPDNHIIVAIKPQKILVPVYNMTVNPSHNYALSAGIIVKNSQAQRPKDDPEKSYLLRANSIAESYEKVRIADFVATLNQTPSEKELGLLRLHLDIYRSNETGKTVQLITNFSKMIFYRRIYGCLAMKDYEWQVPTWLEKRKRS